MFFTLLAGVYQWSEFEDGRGGGVKGHARVSRNYAAIVPLRIAGETLSTKNIFSMR